jgi:hypothetical protein
MVKVDKLMVKHSTAANNLLGPSIVGKSIRGLMWSARLTI